MCDGGDGDDEGNGGRAALKKAPGARHDGGSRSGRGAAVEDPMRKGMTIVAKCWGGRGWDFYRPSTGPHLHTVLIPFSTRWWLPVVLKTTPSILGGSYT